MRASKPKNEEERIDALRSYEILDTDFETSFDRMVELACFVCKTPISAISLVDEDRQWFKAISGLDARETPRDVAFCAHAILQSDVFVVPDATQDHRFADNPLVLSSPDIRFYAGVPLVTSDGLPLGTLCVIDTVPRQLDSAQIEALKTLADQTMAQLDLRLSVRKTKDYVDALKLAEMVYRNSSDGMVVTDEANRIIAINPAFSMLTGYTQDEVVGKNPSLLKSGLQDLAFYQKMWDVITRTGVWQGEIWNRRKNGEVYAELLTVNAIRNADGSIFRYVALFSDVTERKQLDEQLQAHKDELVRSNAELEQFAYVASHDLRQPLRTVCSYLSLLEKSLADRLNDKERMFLDYASQGAKRMSHLISDLLEYSRIGRDERPKVRLELAALVDDAIDDLSAAIAESHGNVVVTGNLPCVIGNSAELARLFQNLIGNAIKYRDPARPPLVEISAVEQGRFCTIAIQDNGIGIAPEHFERIFGVFQRLHGASEYEGTGIGLAVCRKIVEHHGGKISIDSQISKGSTFYFTLKLAD